MTLPNNLSRDLDLLVSAVKKGGAVAMKSFGRKDLNSWLKNGVEPVTEVDMEVNGVLKKDLLGERQDYGWLSEESTDDKTRLSKKYVWVVDPIDGTRAYMKGTPDFCISVALLEDHIPVLGVTYAPALNKFFHAAKGEGAYLNGKPIHVTEPKIVAGIRLQSDDGYIGNAKRWGIPWPDIDVEKFQSFALRLAAFAGGEADAVLSAKPKSEWDVAAGAVLIPEAGGVLCDQDGQPFSFNQENTRLHQVIAISPGVKDEFLEIVKSRIPKNKP